jgi:hypothetical protein
MPRLLRDEQKQRNKVRFISNVHLRWQRTVHTHRSNYDLHGSDGSMSFPACNLVQGVVFYIDLSIRKVCFLFVFLLCILIDLN